jgi:propanol-preferring alcohol dehydrogenase
MGDLTQMKAMVLNKLCRLEENNTPLEFTNLPDPVPAEKEILVRLSACGVCHTELDEIEGRTPPSRFPVVLGHEAVGVVEETGSKSSIFKLGDRVGIAWIYSSCRKCKFCLQGNENLCSNFKATGRDANGGYAQYMTISEDYAYNIPDVFSDLEAAPLLCAGAIGYRSLKLTGLKDRQNLGLVGFGASAHIVQKLVRHQYPNSKTFVFVRSERERAFARELGAVWAGDIEDESPEKLICVIDTTPAWKPVVEALKNLESGGRLVINAIRKEEVDKEYLLQLDYPAHLWLEKEIKSVANICRSDVIEFLEIAAEIPIKPEVQEFALEDANKALVELRMRKIQGAKVLRID